MGNATGLRKVTYNVYGLTISSTVVNRGLLGDITIANGLEHVIIYS